MENVLHVSCFLKRCGLREELMLGYDESNVDSGYKYMRIGKITMEIFQTEHRTLC